jgi:transcriptional regulator with XRE-family HTH domain
VLKSQPKCATCRIINQTVEFVWYCRQVDEAGDVKGNAEEAGGRLTPNQLVGLNMTYFRKAAKLTQEDLGERLGGWSAASVSAAERSWDGRRIRKFDADEIVSISAALGVPLVALFLPPEGDDSYVLDLGSANPPELPGLEALFSRVVPTYAGGTAAMTAYRRRLIAAMGRYMRPEQEQAFDTTQQTEELLAQRVADLHSFEREHRIRLRAYLHERLDELGPEEEDQ